MVRVELTYNPYLLQTEIKFNGNPPRINSLVEKYLDKNLQTWVDKIPVIFHEEMNGYDFDLDFTGTKMDFECLRRSFQQEGISEEQVRLFHKGEIGDREEKAKKVDDLIDWLKETPNRKFDAEKFLEKKKDLLYGSYPFVIIGGILKTDKLFEEIEVSVDNVESAYELIKTDLNNTPVLLYIDKNTISSLQKNLDLLMRRKDVTSRQLFFMISPELKNKVVRVIQDLGINNPQTVDSADDRIIYQYLEAFPVSDYIHESVLAFEKQIKRIGKVLEDENQTSLKYNSETLREINVLDDIVSRLKIANNLFLNRDNLNLSIEYKNAKVSLTSGINKWNSKKTKITNIDEARRLSREYDYEITELFNRFRQAVFYIYNKECHRINDRCREWYRAAGYREYIEPTKIHPEPLDDHNSPYFADDLMKIRNEEYVVPREDLLGKLFKSSAEDKSQTLVLETVFQCAKWRSFVLKTIEPLAEEMIQGAYHSLLDYYNHLTDFYMNQIAGMIQETTEQKENIVARLSVDGRKLQAENDWYTEFCDRLQVIERD